MTAIRSTAIAFLAAALLGGCQTMGGWASADAPAQPETRPTIEGPSLTDGQSRQLLLEMVAKLQGQNLHRAALAYLDEYETRHAGDIDARLLRAKSLSALGMARDAELVYWDLVTTRHAPAAYNGLGIVAAREGRWKAAEQEFRRAVMLRPTNASFLNNLGHAQLRQNLLDEANFTLSQALELKSEDVTTQANLMVCMVLSGREAEARLLLATLREQDRQRVESYVTDYLRQAEAAKQAQAEADEAARPGAAPETKG